MAVVMVLATTDPEEMFQRIPPAELPLFVPLYVKLVPL
jgi:hypothetical protein